MTKFIKGVVAVFLSEDLYEELHGLTFNSSRSFVSKTTDCSDGLKFVSSAHLPMKSMSVSNGSNSVFNNDRKLISIIFTLISNP